MKKVLLPLILIVSLISWAGFVFWNFIHFAKKIDFIWVSSKNIIQDDTRLNSIIAVFKSDSDIQNAFIYSSCKSKTQYITNDWLLYFFRFTLLDSSCSNPNFTLNIEEERYPNTNFILNIQKKSDLFSTIVDYPSSQIQNAHKWLALQIQKYAPYKKLKETLGTNLLMLLKKQRIYNELVYKQTLINRILEKRWEKYSLPVKWYKIATGLNVIPNADRHYRKSYTDGIHHWWDIMAPAGTPVSAIDDGLIIRVVRDFEYADIANIKKGTELTHSDKLRNLDILRGNQVWLKTSKWDVIFYSHLTDIYDNIKEWIILSKWSDIGTIGKSWVPDKNYKNYHLHFPIQRNPYTPKKAWKYSLEDIMGWDWYLKWLDATAVVNGQKNIFKDDSTEK